MLCISIHILCLATCSRFLCACKHFVLVYTPTSFVPISYVCVHYKSFCVHDHLFCVCYPHYSFPFHVCNSSICVWGCSICMHYLHFVCMDFCTTWTSIMTWVQHPTNKAIQLEGAQHSKNFSCIANFFLVEMVQPVDQGQPLWCHTMT